MRVRLPLGALAQVTPLAGIPAEVQVKTRLLRLIRVAVLQQHSQLVLVPQLHTIQYLTPLRVQSLRGLLLELQLPPGILAQPQLQHLVLVQVQLPRIQLRLLQRSLRLPLLQLVN